MYSEHLGYFYPEAEFAVAIGFPPYFRKVLVRLAEAHVGKVSIRLRGPLQPYLLLYAGCVKKHLELPFDVFHEFFREFRTMYPVTLELGEDVYEDDGCVYQELQTSCYLKMAVKSLELLLDSYAVSYCTDHSYEPDIKLGIEMLEVSRIISPLSPEEKNTRPTSIAFGWLTKGYDFRPLSTLSTKPSKKPPKIYYARELREDVD